MKNIYYLLAVFTLMAFTGCTDDEEEFTTVNNVDITLKPENKPNDVIDERVFEAINLDYPGLEKVKAHYEAGEYYYAANELLKYYRNRSNVFDPELNLINPTISTGEQRIADQALEYRFQVAAFYESKDEATGEITYYNFKGSDGKLINWDLEKDASKVDKEFYSQRHRHQWMMEQAKAYRVTQDEKYFNSWKEVYGDWINTFPYTEGTIDKENLPWHGLQPTERLKDQLQLIPYFIQSPNFTPEWLSVVLTVLDQEAETITNNLFNDGNNIYLAQAEALTKAGILMPEMKRAEAWLGKGASIITEELTGQFMEDGVLQEFDPSYHMGVVDGFYSVYKLANANNKLSLFPDTYTTQLKKACRFLMDIVYPNYTIDNFNDTRSARMSKSVILKNLRKYQEMFPDDQEIAWMATEGKQGSKPTSHVQLYKTSGYYMLRNEWGQNSTMMIVKNNANTQNMWHCQPDNGTFGLYRNGRNFCPDAGVYSYGSETSAAENQIRADWAATKNHNTMTKNGVSIAKGYMNGQFVKHTTQGNTEILVTENQSYTDLKHRRTVFFVDRQFFVLVDEGIGNTEINKVDLNFLLCPGKNDVVIDDDADNHIYGAHTVFTDNNNMLFKTFVETTEGYEAENNTSYVSNELGEKTAQRRNYRIHVKKAADKVARFITVIYPFGAPSEYASLDIQAEFIDNAAKVTINSKAYTLEYTL